MNEREHYTHSNDCDFTKKMKKLLLFRKIVEVETIDEQTAMLTLDNGVQIITEGNEGCGGCGNGWYYLDELNACNNAITNVEVVIDAGEYSDVYKIFVFTIDSKINCVQYSGGDNGYYGTGFDVYVKFADDSVKEQE